LRGAGRSRRWLIVGLLTVVGLSSTVGVSLAAFSSSTANGGSSFASDTDWTAPLASPGVIIRNNGSVPGYLAQGGSYRVYGNVTDSGNPASGTASVTANTSTFDSGVTAAALTNGSWTIGGQTYNWRSALLTANGTLSPNTYAFSMALTDADANARTQTGLSVVVDNTAPSASDIQTTNGGVANRPTQGDTIVYTFSEPMDPTTILANWDGTSTAITVTIDQNNPNDRIQTATNLGVVNLGSGSWVSGNAVFAGTMVMSGTVVTITLGTLQSGTVSTVNSNVTLQWTPSATATDRAGNAMSTTARNEQGAADPNF
jgi:hypothetical protein